MPASPLPEAPAGAAELDFTVSISRPDQLTAELLAERPAIVYIPAELLDKMDLMPYIGQAEFCAVLPRIFRTADEPVFRDILQRHPEVASAAIGNLGHLAIVKGLGKTLRGDFGLNMYNSRAVRFWQEQGLSSVTASFELRWQQVRDLGKYVDCEALVYGRLPLMITENCVTKNSVGCAHGMGSVLTDRRGEQFPVLCAYGCRCEIENGKTLVLADKPEVFRCGLRYGRLRFTTETAAECAALLRAHRAGTVTADDNKTVKTEYLCNLNSFLYACLFLKFKTTRCLKNSSASLKNFRNRSCIHFFQFTVYKTVISTSYTKDFKSVI